MPGPARRGHLGLPAAQKRPTVVSRARTLAPTAEALRCRAPGNPRAKTTFRTLKPPDTIRKALGPFKTVSVPPLSLEEPINAADLTEQPATSSGLSEESDMAKGNKRQAVLQLRSEKRRRKMLEMTARLPWTSAGSSFLEATAVSRLDTVEKYQLEVQQFVEEANRRKVRLTGDVAVDAEVVHRFNSLFAQGHQPNRGEVLLAGLMHFAPEFGRGGYRSLPRSWRALKGWRLRCPARSRRPWPLGVWCSLAWVMWLQGFPRMGVF